jgi:hypothetical protein
VTCCRVVGHVWAAHQFDIWQPKIGSAGLNDIASSMSDTASADHKQPLLHLYIDETGPRHPDRAAVPTKHGNDWFAIGGVLIRAEDEQKAKGS